MRFYQSVVAYELPEYEECAPALILPTDQHPFYYYYFSQLQLVPLPSLEAQALKQTQMLVLQPFQLQMQPFQLPSLLALLLAFAPFLLPSKPSLQQHALSEQQLVMHVQLLRLLSVLYQQQPQLFYQQCAANQLVHLHLFVLELREQLAAKMDFKVEALNRPCQVDLTCNPSYISST